MSGERPYQEQFTRGTLPRLWKSGRVAPLAVAPVGAGKTRMAGTVALDRYERGTADFWHLSHRRELVEQPWHLFRSMGIPASRVLSEDTSVRESPVVVASVDTLWNRPICPTRPLCVLSVDEAHRVVGPRYRATVERFRAAYGPGNVRLVLWTATPYRLDGRPLTGIADALAEVVTPAELFESGVLVEPTVLGVESPDLRGLPSRCGDWVREAVAERVDAPKLVGNVVDEWIRLSGGAPSVYFAVNRAHSRHLVERFRAVRVRAEHLDGETSPRERARTLARLSIGGRGSGHPEALDVVVNVDVLREGWDPESDHRRVVEDFPDMWLGRSFPPDYVPLEVLGDCDPTESCCSYRQREGRVCRAHPRKHRALVISHSGNWERHGFLRHHEGFTLEEGLPAEVRERLRASASDGLLRAVHCPGCLAVWPSGTDPCPSCGETLSLPSPLPAEEDAELVVVGDGLPVLPPPDPGREHRRLRELWGAWLRRNDDRRRAGKPAISELQVRVLFRKEFGRWPARSPSLSARAEAEQAQRRRTREDET